VLLVVSIVLVVFHLLEHVWVEFYVRPRLWDEVNQFHMPLWMYDGDLVFDVFPYLLLLCPVLMLVVLLHIVESLFARAWAAAIIALSSLLTLALAVAVGWQLLMQTVD